METDSRHVPAASPPDVAPELRGALATCTTQLQSQHAAVIHEFHQQLFSIAPAVAEMAGRSHPMCQRTVLAALENIQPGQRPTVPAAAVQQIGRDNYLDGFPDAHLGVIAQTILQAIRTVSAEQWSSSLSSIWVQYLMWFQAHLRLGSQAQRAKDMADGGPGAGSPASPGRTAQQRPRPAYGQAGPGDPYPPQRPMDDPRKTQAGSRSEAPRTAAIDKIVVNDGRQQKTLTAAQWKALPLIERAKYLRADPRFYAGGQPIDPREAIATLRS